MLLLGTSFALGFLNRYSMHQFRGWFLVPVIVIFISFTIVHLKLMVIIIRERKESAHYRNLFFRFFVVQVCYRFQSNSNLIKSPIFRVHLSLSSSSFIYATECLLTTNWRAVWIHHVHKRRIVSTSLLLRRCYIFLLCTGTNFCLFCVHYFPYFLFQVWGVIVHSFVRFLQICAPHSTLKKVTTQYLLLNAVF